jgi:hypothetical protein
MPVHAFPGSCNKNRPFDAFPDREIHRACRPGRQRYDHRAAALAHYLQCVMTSFKAEIVNIGTDRFRDSQPVQCQQTRQSVIPGTR